MRTIPQKFLRCCLEASMTHNDANPCLCRLVGTIEVTFNQLAVVEVDGSQLCQGRQAREVSCSRKGRMHKCLHGQLSRNVQLLP